MGELVVFGLLGFIEFWRIDGRRFEKSLLARVLRGFRFWFFYLLGLEFFFRMLFDVFGSSLRFLVNSKED